MAKGIGLIGNFRGKVGNMVGYNLKDSNNKQTQGVRVYQPIVKNPKTYSQANQRAKLAPINVTYRALKQFIDRGQEGKAYGNKSRLAWLSDAMKAFKGGWFEKSETIDAPALVPVSKGTLAIDTVITMANSVIAYDFKKAATEAPTTIAQLTEALIAGASGIQNGDQMTIIAIGGDTRGLGVTSLSVVLDTTNTSSLPAGLAATTGGLTFNTMPSGPCAAAIIFSREGSNGQHLRTNSLIIAGQGYPSRRLLGPAQESASRSYMTSGSNVDWPQEYIEPVYEEPEP